MIPDKLTADNSEKYKVSIRLMPDGISFWGYIPSEKDSFFMETFHYDHTSPTVESLKNIIFNHPAFSYIYQSFYVICVSGKYTMASDHVFVEKEKERFFFFCHPKDKTLKTLVQPVKELNASILFGIEKEIYAFLQRSLSNPQFIYSLSPLLVAWYKKSLHIFPKLMHVVLNKASIDVLCVEQGNLLFVNSFYYDNNNTNDIIYYIMYICKQTGFNQLEDYLTISGNNEDCRKVLSIIDKYVKQTVYLPSTLHGYQVAYDQELTLDMIALVECGV